MNLSEKIGNSLLGATFDVAKKHLDQSAENNAHETKEDATGSIVEAALDLYHNADPTTSNTSNTSPIDHENASPSATHPSRNRSTRRGYDPSKEDKPVS